MNKDKQKKYFNRQYIPIIVGVVLIIILIAFLIYFILNDGKVNISLTTTTTTANKTFDHDEITVDTSSSKCETKTLNQYIKEANAIGINYEIVKEDAGEAVDEDGNKLGTRAYVDRIKIDITNVSENLVFAILNDQDTTEVDLYGADAKNGTLSFYKDYLYVHTTYTFYIYTKDDCMENAIRQFKLEPPSENILYDSKYCEDTSSLYGTKYCEKLVYGETYTIAEAEEKWTEKDEETFENEMNEIAEKDVKKAMKKYTIRRYIIVGCICAAIIIIVICMIIIIKKRGKKNEM